MGLGKVANAISDCNDVTRNERKFEARKTACSEVVTVSDLLLNTLIQLFYN